MVFSANECGVALARALGLPVVSVWLFGYHTGEVSPEDH